MRHFTNPKAIELYERAKAVEKEAQELIANGRITVNGYGDLMTEAAGLRVLADDVEYGIISEDELKGA